MFPKGIVAAAVRWRSKFDRWLDDNRGEAFGAAGLLVFLAFLYWRWAAVGRDPRAGPLFPRYEAPTGIGPAGVRYLDKMECDDRCFASALLGVGQRGYLKISARGGSWEIERTGAAAEVAARRGGGRRARPGAGQAHHRRRPTTPRCGTPTSTWRTR